jgi:subtilisin family serine protease
MGYGDELVVKLKTGTPLSAFDKLLLQLQCSILKKYRFAENTFILSAGSTNEFDALAMANRLFETGLFDYAEPDLTLFDGLLSDPNDPLYNYQWAHNNTGSALQYNGVSGRDMKVQQAWALSMGAGIKVAVIDEGVDINHPDLKDNLLQGFDCTTGTANPGDGKPLGPNRGHGTACTGIIAALANNGIGVAGVAPGSKIIPVNIASANGDFSSYASIAAGFDYAWQQGADIISNSWGGGTPSSILDDAINRAVSLGRGGKGSVVLFASGNNNAGLMYPSSNGNTISVGGVNMCGIRKSPSSFFCDNESWGASYGAGLDVVAPCVKIATTDISGTGGYNGSSGTAGDYYLTFNGTSAATPNVAGVMALILGANSNLTVSQARNVLESSCDKLPSYNYSMVAGQPNGSWNTETGHGLVDAFNAVQMAISGGYCNVQIQANGATRFCPGGQATLSVINPVAGTSYQWRRNGINITGNSSCNAAASGSYDIVATAANGCVAASSPIVIEVTGNTPALAAIAGIDTFICLGQPVKLGGNPVALGGAPWLAEKRAYGMDWFTNNFIRFSLTNPLQFDTVARQVVTNNEYAAGQFFTGGDFTPYGYYAITQKTNKLIKIDTATGVQQLIGIAAAPITDYFQWAGLAWDPATKNLYALASGLDSSGLFIIDPFTAAVTRVATVPLRLTYWLAADNNGNMYTLSFIDSRVYRIDKITGAVTALPGTIGAQVVGQAEPSVFAGRQDADFDPLTNQLYLTTVVSFQNIVSDLRTVDTNTGASSIIGSLGGLSSIDATAIAGPAYLYNWSPAAGLSDTHLSVPVATPLATTTYTLQVTDMCGNTASSQVTVHVNTAKPPVSVKAPIDSICVGETVRLSATKDNSYTYQWYRNGEALAAARDSFYIAGTGGQYTVKVQSGVCDSLSLPITIKTCEIRMNSNEPARVCNYYFFDSGGEQGNYADNESFTRTITASIPGCLPQLTLDSFNTQVNDLLYVYDGPSVAAPLLSVYSGSLKGPLTVRASSNALTLRFVSNGSVNLAGWSGTIGCYQPSVYRSRSSGNFTDINTWEIKSGTDFSNAVHIPLAEEDSIIIKSGDTVTINSAIIIDQVWVKAGAVLSISGNGNVGLRDGPGDDLLVDGLLEMKDATYISGFGKIKLNGNLNYTTTNGQSIYSGIDITGIAPQTITASGSFSRLTVTNPMVTINLLGYISVDTFVINNGGLVNVNGGSFLNVRNQLRLQYGRLLMGNNTVLNIPQISSIIGGNANSFIEGPLRRNSAAAGNISFFYPVGKEVYRPVTLVTNAPPDYNSSYQAEILNAPAVSHKIPTGINAISHTRHTRISNEGSSQGPNTAAITMAYGLDDGVTDAASLRILKDDGAADWINLGGAGTANGAGTIASAIGFTSFGDFVLGNALGGNNVLPVKWVQVSAQQLGKQVQVTWVLSNEVNVRDYILQRSADGTAFTDIALVTAIASTATQQQYQAKDLLPLKGNNYYRIKQTDMDGRYNYSKIVQLAISEAAGFILLPNPATTSITIQNNQLIQQLQCYNGNGQLVYEAKPGATRHTLALQSWAAGIYHVKIISGGRVLTGRFIRK